MTEVWKGADSQLAWELKMEYIEAGGEIEGSSDLK